ncbi:MAG: hypothetical protein ABSC23_08130 [Bryobacteraceae bacterium]
MWQRKASRIGGEFIRHVVPAILKPARTLWNEVIGFLFLTFGAIFGFHAVRYAIRGDVLRLVVAGISTAIMTAYGVSSFRRARKISRS